MLSVCLLYLSCVALGEGFFLIGDEEPVLFCIKVCPLYCSPRRHDEDASSLIYVDEPPPYKLYHDENHEDLPYHYDEDHEVIPYHFDPYFYCKPHKSTTSTTTTTPAPATTTTEEPTLICMICMKKCTKYPKSKKS